MRYSEIRQTLLKGIDSRDWSNEATPRWLSPYPGKMGYVIASMREESPFIPKPRPKKDKPRQRVRGVALREKPWSVNDGS